MSNYSKTIKVKKGFESIKEHGFTVKLSDISFKDEAPLFNSVIYLTKEKIDFSASILAQKSESASLKRSTKNGQAYLFLGGEHFLLDNPSGVEVLTAQGEKLSQDKFNKIYKSANPIYKEDRKNILNFLKKKSQEQLLNPLNPLEQNRDLPPSRRRTVKRV